MNQEILARALRSVVPRSRLFEGIGKAGMIAHSQKENKNQIRTGTTILAFPFVDGIIVAADRKTSGGYMSIISLDTIKLHRVAPFTVIGGAGAVSDIQHIVRMMEEVNGGFLNKFDYPLSIKGQARYIANYLRDFRNYVNPFGLEAEFIVGGLNLMDDLAIFQILSDGCVLETKGYAVIGSGTDWATGVLREENKKIIGRSLSLGEGIDLAVKAISRAGEKDNGTADIRVSEPMIARITTGGYEVVEPIVVAKAVKNLLEKEVPRG